MDYDQIRFSKLLSFAKKLDNRYLLTIASRKIFDEFNKLLTISIIGKKNAEANAKILGSYKYFFATTKEAVRCFFLIELAKFFDEDKQRQTLSIQNVIDFAKKRIESFSVDQFQKYHKERKIIPEIFEKYRALTQKDLDSIEKRINRNKNRVKNLKTYRDKFLAHDDVKKQDILINRRDINVLLRIIKDTIGLLYMKLDFSSISYVNYEEEPILELNHLIKVLKESEDRRLLNFREEYHI
jgi:hypothetical protein